MENDVVIDIKGLKVWTPEEKSWWRRKPTKPQNIILNNGKYLLNMNTVSYTLDAQTRELIKLAQSIKSAYNINLIALQ